MSRRSKKDLFIFQPHAEPHSPPRCGTPFFRNPALSLPRRSGTFESSCPTAASISARDRLANRARERRLRAARRYSDDVVAQTLSRI